ncbi:MAG TPA: hypothetical protein VNR51_10780 [Hyphomicrobium sp.]|nr:hypothetical protein [Hyphomicrobium sp.]
MKRASASQLISAEANSAAVSAARADGEAAGAAAAYRRMTTILADPRVRGREGAALALAARSQDMAPVDIAELMEMLATSRDRAIGAFEQRIESEIYAPLPGGAGKETGEAPDFVSRMRERHGLAP